MWATVRVDAERQRYGICYGRIADLRDKRNTPMSQAPYLVTTSSLGTCLMNGLDQSGQTYKENVPARWRMLSACRVRPSRSNTAAAFSAFPPTINPGTSDRNRFISRSLKKDLCRG